MLGVHSPLSGARQRSAPSDPVRCRRRRFLRPARGGELPHAGGGAAALVAGVLSVLWSLALLGASPFCRSCGMRPWSLGCFGPWHGWCRALQLLCPALGLQSLFLDYFRIHPHPLTLPSLPPLSTCCAGQGLADCVEGVEGAVESKTGWKKQILLHTSTFLAGHWLPYKFIGFLEHQQVNSAVLQQRKGIIFDCFPGCVQ